MAHQKYNNNTKKEKEKWKYKKAAITAKEEEDGQEVQRKTEDSRKKIEKN